MLNNLYYALGYDYQVIQHGSNLKLRLAPSHSALRSNSLNLNLRLGLSSLTTWVKLKVKSSSLLPCSQVKQPELSLRLGLSGHAAWVKLKV
jgi:hypothetical protein